MILKIQLFSKLKSVNNDECEKAVKMMLIEGEFVFPVLKIEYYYDNGH